MFYQLYDAGINGSKPDLLISYPGLVTIVASSPDKSNYRQFAKSSSPRMVYMEPRSYGELKCGNKLLKKPLDERTLRKRYALVGGIPRWVFKQSFNIEDEVCSIPYALLCERFHGRTSGKCKRMRSKG